MKRNKLYGLILSISVLIFSGCGTDTKENPAAPDGPYSFFNATTPITITQGGGMTCSTCVINNGIGDHNGTTISVQLLKYGLAEPLELVQMLPFDNKYGSLVDTVTITDQNGRAVFEYVAPEGNDYSSIRGSNVTIQAVFEKPIEEGDYVDPDAPPVIILTQEFLLQFR